MKISHLLCMGAIIPTLLSASIDKKCCYDYAYNPPVLSTALCGIELEVSYLYLKPKIDNFFYANNILLGNGDDLVTQVDPKMVYHDWDSGFSVGLGYNLPCDHWKVKLHWDHLRTDSSIHQSGSAEAVGSGLDQTSGNIVLTPNYPLVTALSGTDITVQSEIEGKFRFEWNQLDLLFSREYLVGSHLSFSPIFGLRALFLENKVDLNGEVNNSSNASATIYRENYKNHFRSLGLVAGFDANYDFYCNLGLYGKVTGSILYGENEVNNTLSSLVDVSNSGSLGTFPIHYCNDNLKPTIDMFLGLQWRNPFDCDCADFFIRLGWEHHYLFNLFEVNHFPVSSTYNGVNVLQESKNVSLYGFRFNVGFNF